MGRMRGKRRDRERVADERESIGKMSE